MERPRASAAWKKSLFAAASYDPNVDGDTLEEIAEALGCSVEYAEEIYYKHCDATVQKFRVGDRVIAEPTPGYRLEGTVTYAGEDGAVEVIEDSGSGGMFNQHMISAAPAKRKDDGEKPPVADTCDDCGADVAACGCKSVARADAGAKELALGLGLALTPTNTQPAQDKPKAKQPKDYVCPAKGPTCEWPKIKPKESDMEPGPELAAMLEQFAQDVFQKRMDELTYDEVVKLRDMLVTPADSKPVIHEISAVDPENLPWISNSWGTTTLDQIEKRLEEMSIYAYQASLNSADSDALEVAFSEEGGTPLSPPWHPEQLLRVIQVLGDSDDDRAQDLRQGILQTLRIEEI